MKKIAVITIVLCFVSVGMLSGCVNPLDPKEQFIGTWEFVGVEEESIMGIITPPQDITQIWIFYRNNTLELRSICAGETSSIFTTYQVTSEYLIVTEPEGTEECMAWYSFPDPNTLVLTNEESLSWTFIKVSGG